MTPAVGGVTLVIVCLGQLMSILDGTIVNVALLHIQVSAAIGVAVLGTLSSERTRSLLGAGAHLQPALLDGYRLGFAVGAGCVAAAVLAALVWFLVPPLRRATGTPSPQA